MPEQKGKCLAMMPLGKRYRANLSSKTAGEPALMAYLMKMPKVPYGIWVGAGLPVSI
ncbi:MAG: hypothetical protein ABFS56_23010 [Pseudomonadota bacterium]